MHSGKGKQISTGSLFTQHYYICRVSVILNCFNVNIYFRLSESALFLNMWVKFGQEEVEQKKRPLSMTEVINNVWKNARESWNVWRSKIVSGDITFKEFHKCFKNNVTIEQELELLSEDNNDWIRKRMDQYQHYLILEQSVYGANVILKVAKEYELKGNFQPIKTMKELVR